MMPGTITEQRADAVTVEADTYRVVDLYSPEQDQGRTVQSLGSYSVAGWGIEE
ncbi:hypothetical protein [Streptomyces ipomoeae]|uniref:hypothetical protein n=1 Tax=Streptomyces ipomoeae TaxID=103232 RepID=UPI0015EFFD50|nr:hypothetical protein [Streptomyces ipomoeae]